MSHRASRLRAARSTLLVAVLVLAVLLPGAVTGAPPGVAEQRVIAGDPQVRAYFGDSVAVHGDRAVVGARFEDTAGEDAGAAYVFARGPGGWTQEAKLVPTDARSWDYFGISAAIAGDTIVVGAHGSGGYMGAAYVFERVGASWAQKQKLVPSGTTSRGQFGIDLALDGDRLVVGAPADSSTNPSGGAAYVFERSGGTWSQVKRLTAPVPTDYAHFGVDVGVSGDRAVVGATGLARVFVHERGSGAWSLTATLQGTGSGSSSRFGEAVDVEGDRVAVGAWLGGRAHVFDKVGSVWLEAAVLTPTLGSGGAFGYDVAVDDGRVLVGSRDNNEGGSKAGAAFLFVNEGAGWQDVLKLIAADSSSGAQIGHAVSLDGLQALAGAWQDSRAGIRAGAAYFWHFDADGDGVVAWRDNCPDTPNADQTDTSGNGYGDACDPTGSPDGAYWLARGRIIISKTSATAAPAVNTPTGWSCTDTVGLLGDVTVECDPSPPPSGLVNGCKTLHVEARGTGTGTLQGRASCGGTPMAGTTHSQLAGTVTSTSSSTVSPPGSFPVVCEGSGQVTLTSWRVVCDVNP